MSPSKDDPSHTVASSNSKIAIKGFSLSAKSGASSRPSANPQSSLGKRPRATLDHEEDSDSGDDRKHGKHEVVTGFGEGGAIKHVEEKSAGPLVIPSKGNKRWRPDIPTTKSSGKNLLPPEVQAQIEAARLEREGKGSNIADGVDVANGNDEAIQWGLSVRKRIKVEEETSGMIAGEPIVKTNGISVEAPVEPESAKPKSADEEALEALLGKNKERKGPDLVIPSATENSALQAPISEQDAYRRAIESAPDASTLDDYERVPVGEFGVAMLRGMGWKGDKTAPGKEVKRRQNLLGLGASELKGAEELGAWVQHSDIKRLKNGQSKGVFGGRDRKPNPSEYKRDKDRQKEERGGGSYRRDRESNWDRDYRRSSRRDEDYDRDGERDRERRRR